MKNRIILVLLACMFLLAFVSGASAQGSDCLNLSEADCAVLHAAETNSDNINSVQMGFAIDFTLNGLEAFAPEAAGGIEFHLSGQGPLVGNPSADETAMMSGDIASALSAIQMQMDGNLSVKAPDTNVSSPFSFVITGGNLYFQDPQSEQWMGMTGDTIAAQLEQFTSMMGAMGGAGGSTTPTDPSQLMSQLPPELMTAIMSTDWEAIAQTPGFLNYQRLPDETMMDQAMSPFQFTADFGTLFKSPEFQAAINQIIQAAQQANTSTDPQAAQQAQMAAAMIPMFLNGTTGTLNVTQWVGTSDQFIHKIAVDLNANMDLSALMAASGGNTSNATPMQPIALTFHFELTFDQINGTFTITAPEGAQMITPDMMGASS